MIERAALNGNVAHGGASVIEPGTSKPTSGHRTLTDLAGPETVLTVDNAAVLLPLPGRAPLSPPLTRPDNLPTPSSAETVETAAPDINAAQSAFGWFEMLAEANLQTHEQILALTRHYCAMQRSLFADWENMCLRGTATTLRVVCNSGVASLRRIEARLDHNAQGPGRDPIEHAHG